MEEIGNRNSTCRAAAARNCCRSVVRRCRGANWRRRRCLLIVFQLKINSYSDGIGTSPATAPDQTPVFTIFEKVSNSISNQQLSAVSNCCCCSLSLSLSFCLFYWLQKLTSPTSNSKFNLCRRSRKFPICCSRKALTAPSFCMPNQAIKGSPADSNFTFAS